MITKAHMRYPGGRDKALTFSFDDGQIHDIRLIEMMRDHGVKSTFCLCSKNHGGDSEGFVCHTDFEKVYYGNGMEIACHTAHHTYLTGLPVATALADMISDRAILEHMTGRIIRGLAFPFGNWNAQISALAGACGFAYARATTNLHAFTQPENWLAMPISCRQWEDSAFDLAASFREDRLAPAQDPYLFHILGHSFEFDRANSWDRFDRLLGRLEHDEGVYYATNLDICDYTRSYRSLCFSADGGYVRNPASNTVWFTLGETLYRVEPGETLDLHAGGMLG